MNNNELIFEGFHVFTCKIGERRKGGEMPRRGVSDTEWSQT
jgi:hypothetical protein